MTTPAEHRQAAMDGITRINDQTKFYDSSHVMVAQIHAHLASATGAGQFYQAADALLARIARPSPAIPDPDDIASAFIYAILADRA